MPWNKPIIRMKLGLTTDCNLDCGYCFVRCEPQSMTWAVARRSVDLLLASPSKDKVLSCYGGEPLLQFSLLTKIVLYARERAGELEKRLRIVVCSNGHLLTDAHLDFFRRHDVRLHISLFADARAHRRYRGPGFGDVRAALQRSVEFLEEGMAGACLCVTPATVGSLTDDIARVAATTGCRLVNIEVISHDQPWVEKDVRVFDRQFRQLLSVIGRGIVSGQPIWLNAFCWRAGFGAGASLGGCPFGRYLEISPDGKMAFSPFNLYAPEPLALGSVKDPAPTWWRHCSFNTASSTCRDCLGKHFFTGDADDHVSDLFRNMSAMIGDQVVEFKEKSRRDARFARYIKDARHYAS
ncbi:MAG: radical SAM protein [Candidatus Omnitrophota bacterium]